MMIKYAHKWFKEKGVSVVRIETAASNKVALSFYKKFGYKPIYMVLEKEQL